MVIMVFGISDTDTYILNKRRVTMGLYFFFTMVLGPIFVVPAMAIGQLSQVFDDFSNKINDFLFN